MPPRPQLDEEVGAVGVRRQEETRGYLARPEGSQKSGTVCAVGHNKSQRTLSCYYNFLIATDGLAWPDHVTVTRAEEKAPTAVTAFRRERNPQERPLTRACGLPLLTRIRFLLASRANLMEYGHGSCLILNLYTTHPAEKSRLTSIHNSLP